MRNRRMSRKRNPLNRNITLLRRGVRGKFAAECLVAGLGNPGARYRHDRHNVGFMVIEQWSHELGVRLTSRRFQSRSIRVNVHGKNVILLRPMTFMNRSGGPVKACAEASAVETDRILVVHDDLDIPVGRLKVAGPGGAGGHKGVSSIMQSLGDNRFARIKIGIGRPRNGERIEDYVLAPFYSDQVTIVKEVVHAAVKACGLFVEEGIEAAMNHINCLNFSDKEERD